MDRTALFTGISWQEAVSKVVAEHTFTENNPLGCSRRGSCLRSGGFSFTSVGLQWAGVLFDLVLTVPLKNVVPSFVGLVIAALVISTCQRGVCRGLPPFHQSPLAPPSNPSSLSLEAHLVLRSYLSRGCL